MNLLCRYLVFGSSFAFGSCFAFMVIFHHSILRIRCCGLWFSLLWLSRACLSIVRVDKPPSDFLLGLFFCCVGLGLRIVYLCGF